MNILQIWLIVPKNSTTLALLWGSLKKFVADHGILKDVAVLMNILGKLSLMGNPSERLMQAKD